MYDAMNAITPPTNIRDNQSTNTFVPALPFAAVPLSSTPAHADSAGSVKAIRIAMTMVVIFFMVASLDANSPTAVNLARPSRPAEVTHCDPVGTVAAAYDC